MIRNCSTENQSLALDTELEINQKLQIDIIQGASDKVSRLTYINNSFPKGVKLHREFKVTVLSVNKFACTSWYSMN